MNSKNILVVGCGGIGCELIKILHVNKCCNITLVDYDTISTSNLSRQFFFTTEDVNKYKCQVIAEKYKKWNANATVNYYKDDITNSSFDYNFYKKFDLVFNCLDNREARTFISRRCAFTGTPIIDGGSKAFLGQAWFYMTNIECYDCLDKQVDSSIPVCTIRSFPSTYEHCVIWTKEHFLVKLFAINNEVEIKELIKDIVKENCHVDDNDVQELTKTCMSIVEIGITEYDKDNVDLNLLCYKVAKLRANSFGIDALSEFETEAILGNIVPIVGTTNAIIASLMYQIGTDYLKGNVIHNFYLSNNARIINKVRSVKWKEDCKFCNSKKMLLYKIDSILIDTLIEKFEEYGTISRIFDSNDVYYDKNYTVETDYTIELHNDEILHVQIDTKTFSLLVIEGDVNKIADVR